MERNTGFERLRRIRDEYEAVRLALAETLCAVRTDAFVQRASIAKNLSIGEFQRAIKNVERTYLVRLFSEFEGIAVHYYHHGLKRRGLNPRIAAVMAVLSHKHAMDQATQDAAAEVRAVRNHIIHRGEHVPTLDFPICLRRLGRFLSWLPQNWPDV